MKLKKVISLAIVLTMLAAMSVTVQAGDPVAGPPVRGAYFQPIAGGQVYYFDFADLMTQDGSDVENMKETFRQLLEAAAGSGGLLLDVVVDGKNYPVTYSKELLEEGKNMADQILSFAGLNEEDRNAAVEGNENIAAAAITVKSVKINEETGAVELTVEKADGTTGTVDAGSLEDLKDPDKQDEIVVKPDVGVGLVAKAKDLTITATATIVGIEDALNATFTFKKVGGVDPVFEDVIVIVDNKAVTTYTAEEAGIYEVQVTLDDAEETTSVTRTLTLTAPPVVDVTGVTLDETTAALVEGDTLQLTATVLPEDATNKAVTWSSSDETVATVDESGLVTAVAAGTATITVTTVDGDFTANCVVTIEPAVVEPEFTWEIDPDFPAPTGSVGLVVRLKGVEDAETAALCSVTYDGKALTWRQSEKAFTGSVKQADNDDYSILLVVEFPPELPEIDSVSIDPDFPAPTGSVGLVVKLVGVEDAEKAALYTVTYDGKALTWRQSEKAYTGSVKQADNDNYVDNVIVSFNT